MVQARACKALYTGSIPVAASKPLNLHHHAVVVVTEGESFRMKEAKARGGGRPKKTASGREPGRTPYPGPLVPVAV